VPGLGRCLPPPARLSVPVPDISMAFPACGKKHFVLFLKPSQRFFMGLF
jgi:hypothetical protein